jgi:hypothetical protein
MTIDIFRDNIASHRFIHIFRGFMHKARRIRIYVLGILLGVVFLIIAGFLGIYLFLKHMEAVDISKVPEVTLEKAQRLFEEVGGLKAVNQEAKVLLARCKMKDKDYQILYQEDLKDTPSIAFLVSKLENYSGIEYSGTGIIYFGSGGSHYLLVKFGNHFVHRHIYIFDTDTETTVNPVQPWIVVPSQSWIKVEANIFVEN